MLSDAFRGRARASKPLLSVVLAVVLLAAAACGNDRPAKDVSGGNLATTTTAFVEPTNDAELEATLVRGLQEASGNTFPLDQAQCWVKKLVADIGGQTLVDARIVRFPMGASDLPKTVITRLPEADQVRYLDAFQSCVNLYEVMAANVKSDKATLEQIAEAKACLKKTTASKKAGDAFAIWLLSGKHSDPRVQALVDPMMACYKFTK